MRLFANRARTYATTNTTSTFLSAASAPSTNAVTPDVVTGAGNLQWLGLSGSCVTGSNIWITNLTVTLTGSNTATFAFAIAGGASGVPYDVFASAVLATPATNTAWAWMGEGYACNAYSLTNLPRRSVFLSLGTPQDADGDGLTDAYENYVSHTDPQNAYSNLDGILDGWEILLGLNPRASNLTQPGTRANYAYTLADWLLGVSGARNGAITLDNEGNVLQVSQ